MEINLNIIVFNIDYFKKSQKKVTKDNKNLIIGYAMLYNKKVATHRKNIYLDVAI